MQPKHGRLTKTEFKLIYMTLTKNETQHALRILAKVAFQQVQEIENFATKQAQVYSNNEKNSKLLVLDFVLHADKSCAKLKKLSFTVVNIRKALTQF